MAFKLIALAALVAAANAGVLAPAPLAYHAAPAYGYAAPIAKTIVKTIDADYDHNPEYSFSYDVHDDHTGDIKSQQETRHGDVVEGSYSLIEADGTRRIVEYKADDHSGFNAIVHKEPTGHAPKYAAPIVAKYAAPVIAKYAAPAIAKYAAPTITKYAAPIAHHAYAAPIAHHAYAAPIAHHAYAAPAAHIGYAAPAAHIGYAAPAAHVSYSAPAYNYHH